MAPKPDISPNFTIEDIPKIREYHYELTKDMSLQERSDFYNEGAKIVQSDARTANLGLEASHAASPAHTNLMF